MFARPAFLAAFWAGLAAPIALYAPPAPYAAYVGGISLPLSFAATGVRLSIATGRDRDGTSSKNA